MPPELKAAFKYWRMIKMVGIWNELGCREYMSEDLRETALMQLKTQLELKESFEQLTDKAYLDLLIKAYGHDMESSPLPVCKAMMSAKMAAKVNPEYRNFAEILTLNQSKMSSSYALQYWLRSRSTLEFLAVWEQNKNPAFDSEQAKELIRESKETTATITLKKWISRTGSVGIIAIPGRYGGTYADPIIANDFEAWLSPKHRYLMITLFMKRESIVDL